MDTLHLKLPYLMPSQAQKHVTHNEALLALDFIVQLAVESRDLTTPPENPGDGDRYIVGPGADGEWTGHDGEVACAIDGGWCWLAPRDGWLAWVRDEGSLHVRRDGGWHGVVESFTSLGVNTTPDAMNRLAVASPASLFTHDGGDHQMTVNKANAASRATLVFQTGYEGRAEIGLVGDDDLVFKVSADGANFVEALRVDKASGDVCVGSLNSGPLAGFRNAVINGAGAINQRGFSGGALAGYGYDRWRSEGSGCTVSVAAGRFTLTGAITQTIENARLAGSVVTISVDAPSNPLYVTLGSKSGTIPAGAGRQHVTLSLGTSEADNLKLVIGTAETTSFGEIQVERGPRPTPFEARPAALEEVLCRRYFEATHPVFSGATVSGGTFRVVAPYTVAKRIVPMISIDQVEFSSNVPTATSAYTSSGLSRTTGAHLFFVANTTASSASVQLKVTANAEF